MYNRRNLLSTVEEVISRQWVYKVYPMSIEIKQISFVYLQNRFTVVVVLKITNLILAFVKVGLVYISNIYIR